MIHVSGGFVFKNSTLSTHTRHSEQTAEEQLAKPTLANTVKLKPFPKKIEKGETTPQLKTILELSS